MAATHGPIDVLINNAAQDPGVRLVDIGEDDYRHTFDVNFFAPIAATLGRHALDGRARRRASSINVSSDGGRLPSPGPGAYPSSKAALSAFSESASFRLGPKGVRVHVVYPAFMATELGLGALGRGLRQPPRLTRRKVTDGVAPDPGAGGRPLAGDQRVGADRRGHGVPRVDAPHLPPFPSQLVTAALTRVRRGGPTRSRRTLRPVRPSPCWMLRNGVNRAAIRRHPWANNA